MPNGQCTSKASISSSVQVWIDCDLKEVQRRAGLCLIRPFRTITESRLGSCVRITHMLGIPIRGGGA